jgi:hypothetical protein
LRLLGIVQNTTAKLLVTIISFRVFLITLAAWWAGGEFLIHNSRGFMILKNN